MSVTQLPICAANLETARSESHASEIMANVRQVITVMPDYGMGPYAWEKPVSDQSPYVGLCIATAKDGFEADDGTKISSVLENEFNEWTGQFEQFADRPDFDWVAFHREGLRLSHKLKAELGFRTRSCITSLAKIPNEKLTNTPRSPVTPNPSVEARPNGRPPWPGLRYSVHCLSPGQGVLPLVPPHLER